MTHWLIDKIKEFEGFSAKPYLCPAGFPTIGYGHLVKPGEVSKLTELNDASATALLITDLEEAAAEAITLLPGIEAHQHQLEAMASWVMNLGATNLSTSTLRRKYNAGDINGAGQEITRWVHCHVNGKKVVLKGLVRRREWEKKVFLHGVY